MFHRDFSGKEGKCCIATFTNLGSYSAPNNMLDLPSLYHSSILIFHVPRTRFLVSSCYSIFFERSPTLLWTACAISN